MDSKIYFIIGILFLIIIIALAIDTYFNLFNTIEEGFQSLSKRDIANLIPCTADTSGCAYIQYYDASSNLKNGYFLLSTIPANMYIDSENILQPIPYGNKVNSDYKGYSTDTYVSIFSDNSKLAENAIVKPQTCDLSDTVLYYPGNPNSKYVCYDVSYITINEDTPIMNRGGIIIPDGYYVNSGILTVVPYGYAASSDKKTIRINIDFSNQISNTKYNSNNFDITYHTDGADMSTYDDYSTAGQNNMWILDNSGNLISVPYSEISGNTLYNEPGSFRFGSSNYIPNYAESVYLSKLTNVSTVSPVINSAESSAGFCSSLYPDKNALEQACNALDKDACASTSCCALLGGEKCVYGNENGPYFKSNYSNFMVKNTEFYYYQGKCYGNCT